MLYSAMFPNRSMFLSASAALSLLCFATLCRPGRVAAEDAAGPRLAAPETAPSTDHSPPQPSQPPVPIQRRADYYSAPAPVPVLPGPPFFAAPGTGQQVLVPAPNLVPRRVVPNPARGGPGALFLAPGDPRWIDSRMRDPRLAESTRDTRSIVVPRSALRTPESFFEGGVPATAPQADPIPAIPFDSHSSSASVSPVATLPPESATESAGAYAVELLVTESFVNRLVDYRLAESGPVREVIQGADVTGWQLTDGRLTVDFQPSERVGTVELVLAGETQSDTLGRTPQATIKSMGFHQFVVSKPILIGQWRLMTRKTTGRVLPSTTHVGARTPLSGVPLLGQLSGRIAYRAAQRRKTAAEIEAGQKLLDKMMPRMDNEVDRHLARANSWQRDELPGAIKRIDLAPVSSEVSSSHDAIRVRLAFPEKSAAAASELPDAPTQTSGESAASASAQADSSPAAELGWEPPAAQQLKRDRLSLAIHESLANRLLKQVEFEPIRIPDERLSELWTSLGTILNDLMQGQSPQLPSLEEIQSGMARLASVELDSKRPIHWEFREGEAAVTFFVTFFSTIGTRLGEQEVTIPFSTELSDGQITLKPGRVRVSPVRSTDALGLLVQSIIRQQITQRIKHIEFLDTFQPTHPELDHVQFRIDSITADRGWLRVVIAAQPRAEQTVQR